MTWAELPEEEDMNITFTSHFKGAVCNYTVNQKYDELLFNEK